MGDVSQKIPGGGRTATKFCMHIHQALLRLTNRAMQILKQNWILWAGSFTGCMMETQSPNTFWLAIKFIFTFTQGFRVGRDRAVCITTCHRLGGPGIKFGLGRNFSHPFRHNLRLTQPPVHGYWFSFPGVKPQGRSVHNSPPSRVEVNERVKVYSSSGPSCFVVGKD